MGNLDIYESAREVPETAKKTIGAGRLKGMTDVNPMWRIKKLTELFGPCGIGWYIRPVSKWTESSGDEIKAFVDVELYIWDKEKNSWSQPICGTGGSSLVSKEKSGLYVSDECYKMAYTDAISVACKMLGIGADVYWQQDRTKYSQKQETNASDKLATTAQKRTIDSICRKHKISTAALCTANSLTWDTLTADDAGKLLVSLKRKYGDD